MARLRLWLVMLPLVVAGTEGGASLVDQFAPREYEGAELFSRTNESHALLLPAAALGVAALLLAVWACTAAAPARMRLPRWVFACLPPLVFFVQEHVEHLISHGAPWTLAADPTFVAGLCLQLPFALAAYLVARLLVAAAAAIARRRTAAPPVAAPPVVCFAPAPAPFARLRLAGTRRLTRGPPRLLAV
jgi:apolipoprotein N-acyltransferase